MSTEIAFILKIYAELSWPGVSTLDNAQDTEDRGWNLELNKELEAQKTVSLYKDEWGPRHVT